MRGSRSCVRALRFQSAVKFRSERPVAGAARSLEDGRNLLVARKSAFAHVGQAALDRGAFVVAWPIDAVPAR